LVDCTLGMPQNRVGPGQQKGKNACAQIFVRAC
jgi:hypothetical protein